MIHLDMHWELRDGADGRRALRMLWRWSRQSAIPPGLANKNEPKSKKKG